MPNYTKLFNSIVTSTIWTEDDKTRIVWITMLALADQNGEVHASTPGLARVAGVSVPDTEKAIECFLGPDKFSRTKDFDGRRIVAIDGGWELLNHAKYRKMASKEDAKAANAERQRRHRERNASVTPSNAPCENVTEKRDIAEAEAEADSNKKKKASSRSSPKSEKTANLPFSSAEFADAWDSWLLFRKELRKPLPPSTISRQFSSFAKWGERKSILAIANSIEQGWQGLFEPKDKASDPGFQRPINEPTPFRAFD